MHPVHREIFCNLIWPCDPQYDQLYKCVTTIFPDRKKPGNNITVNHVAQSYDDVLRLIEARSQWRGANVYGAIGVQRMAQADTSNDGFQRAIRKGHNMVSFNALFMDIDVGKKDCYPTQADAIAAVIQFCQDSGMPEPTMWVSSGSGGLHIYWCTYQPMPVADWQVLADALKAAATHHRLKQDPAVTADAARVLRIPTTYNYKTNPPTMVDLLKVTTQYTMQQLSAPLAQFVSGRSAKQVGGAAAPTSAWTQNFTSGVDEQNLPRKSIDEIAVNCPAVAQTLATGGAQQSEPQWSQMVFLSSWADDPVAAAHRLSNGHSGYSVSDTDKKLAEKQAAIAAGQLGWPKCANMGHPACQTCPMLALGRSPIHFAHQQQAQAQPMQPASTADPLMPPDYWRNVNNHVFTNVAFGPTDVLGYPILDGGVDAVNGDLVLKTEVGGVERWGNISLAKQTPQGIVEALTKGTRNGIIVRGNPSAAKGFVMAWINHLQQTKQFISPRGFGWSDGSFVFGDEVFTPNGPVSAYRGNTIDEKFQRKGDAKPWHAAMQLVYGNPPLEATVASSFAAPLVELACDFSVVLSLFSHESGVGKSTALKLAQSVWGHPRTGMSMLDDTANSVNKKISDLKNLPIYWDEMKTKDQVQRVVQIVFSTTQGRSKARLSRDSSQMDVGVATTLFAVATNHGIINHVVRETEGTEAGGLRVFEINALPLVNTPLAAKAEQLIIPLNENYGVLGAIYVDFLVRNKATARQVLQVIADELQKTYNFSSKERFWKNTMVVIIGGAMLSNHAGLTTFDVAAIQRCLGTALLEMRGSGSRQSYGMTGSNGSEILSEMMAELRGKSLIVTDVVPTGGMGRPPMINVDPFSMDYARLGHIWMQVGKNDGRVLATARQFDHWLIKHGYMPEQAIKLIKQDYYVVERYTSVGAGVNFLAGLVSRARCYDLTPKAAPPAPSRNPSSPSSSFGSLAP